MHFTCISHRMLLSNIIFQTNKIMIIVYCLNFSMVERIIKDIYLLGENIFERTVDIYIIKGIDRQLNKCSCVLPYFVGNGCYLKLHIHVNTG